MDNADLMKRLFPGGAAGEFDPYDYAHLWPPPGFYPVERNGSRSISGVATTTLFTIQPPPGYEGWLVHVGLQSSDFSTCTFRFMRGNAPIRDYENITLPIGQPDNVAQVFMQLVPNVVLSLQALTTAGAVNNALRWRVFGWYYQRPI